MRGEYLLGVVLVVLLVLMLLERLPVVWGGPSALVLALLIALLLYRG